jgi:ubiquinone/menaquinone biosynthesis C-methylase UbiE
LEIAPQVIFFLGEPTGVSQSRMKVEVHMLSRTLEPELMDSEDEAREYDLMDHSAVNRCFVADFLAVHQQGWKILDVGTGTSQIPVELCSQEKRAIVLAIDAAEHMLERGAKNVAAAGLVGRIHLQRMDAKKLDFGDGSFSAVISNSIVHHIEKPQTVLREMFRVLAPGGSLFVRDLMRPDDDSTVTALVDTYAAGATEPQRAMFGASLRAALTLDELRELTRPLGIPDSAAKQTSDRHWTLNFRR